jgi:hypothetical protein
VPVLAQLMPGDNDKALVSVQAAVREIPNYPVIHRIFACALVRVGRIDEARQAMSRSLQLEPGWSLSRGMLLVPWRDRPFGIEMRAALALAGAPE